MNQRRHGRARPVLAIGLVFLFVAFLAGCAGKGKVSGRVLYQEKPLPGGWVTFRPADSRENAVSVPISPEGKYEATLPTGEVQISVDNRDLQPSQPIAPPELPPGIKLPKKGAGGPAPKTGPAKDAEPQKPAGTYVAIPEKYYSTDSSGLSYTVKRGNQSHDIPLK
jgi:hypothetical protein